MINQFLLTLNWSTAYDIWFKTNKQKCIRIKPTKLHVTEQ